MKAWISIAAVLGIALVASLWVLVYRHFSAEAGLGSNTPPLEGELAQRGLQVAVSQGCVACHTLDGSAGIGPTWLGMFGRVETLADDTEVVVDEAYFRESIAEPAKKVVKGYQNIMIPYFLSDSDMAALLEFAKQMGVEHHQAQSLLSIPDQPRGLLGLAGPDTAVAVWLRATVWAAGPRISCQA
jgi:cytochrome c2